MQNASLHITDTSTLYVTLQLWLEALQARGASARTLKNYRESVTPFITFLTQQGCFALEDVQPVHIRRWLLHRQQQNLSTHTLHNSYRNPRAFWNWCIREGLTEHNPFAKVEPPKREQVLKPALTPEEVEKLLQACTGKDWLNLRDRALILLLLDTGLRIHECHQLRVGDVAGDTVVIKGKGGKQRVVVLSAEVRLAVQRYLKAYQTQHGVKLQADSPLWWGASGALTLHGIKLAVRKAGKRAGLRLGAHQLRRTFATWSLRAGIDLEHLRLLMGHSDLKTTQVYLSLVEQDLKQAHQQHSPLNLLRGRR
ncbi:MAG: tyrosine recombinase XerD [Armatimonadota bacterium]|nr:MAG: tyrosine recombinase XerD [Armatimonadota bacterium]GIV18711.1 MAG: tyrosine recombinase XerD [Armatimonadota bacterium]